jgi:hypothetical protein
MRVAVLGYARGGLRNRLDKGNRPPSLSAARKQSCDLAKEKRSNGEWEENDGGTTIGRKVRQAWLLILQFRVTNNEH